ncbi:alpha/beta fold hydrolase [Nitratireductor sp. ZSWI3]|uniref:alpha/beta fold hydrolase n=1 Tax=Nitratireductor sp. ZSWI3 TaxID=2966359 RepID=UPI00214F7BD1|nr:alpha/beta hydrolase [Nitratireductor sp. ZSWI3]MCR4265165.1 alpha/beta hydrolase [Nitratireductor sp. ZSWI3]
MGLTFEADPESHRPPLLLVHGLLSSRRHWLPNRALSETFRLIRVDLPAHGASRPPSRSEDARPEALARALDAVRETLGIARWYLCGQSFGAGLSLRYALDFPDRCIAHAFTNGNAALRAAWPDKARSENEELCSRIATQGHTAIRDLPYHPAHARRFPSEIHAMLSADADTVDPEGFALLIKEAIPRLSARERLSELQVPTLLVNGLLERRFQPARAWLAAAHPGVEIVDLQGGHSINIECPEAFNAALRRFFKRYRR